MRGHAHKSVGKKRQRRDAAPAEPSTKAKRVSRKAGHPRSPQAAHRVPPEVAEKKQIAHGGRHSVSLKAVDYPSGNAGVFQALLDSLNIGVAHVTAEGEILYANERFAEVLGAKSEEKLTGDLLREHVSSANWVPLFRALQSATVKPIEGELRISRPGFNQTLRLSFAPLGNGSPTIGIAATEVTELVEKTRALRESEASLHTVTLQLLKMQDQERRTMARDLHDVTGQELAVAVVALDRLSRNLDAPKANLQASLEECAGWIRKVENEIRTLSYVLHPPLLDEMGLGMALDVFTKGFTKRTGIEVNLEAAENLPRLSVEKEVGLFRVIQECLSNVFRHSGSQRAWVNLSRENGSFRVSVRDEGRGMPAGQNGAAYQPGVGMQSMTGRTRLMGGALEIKSNRRGTEIIATVPVAEADVLLTDRAINHASPETNSVEAAGSQEVSRKRVLIVDDHEVARQGIKALLKDEPDLEICGEAEDGLEAIERAKALRPDLIIMDLTMPHMGGFSAANRIRESGLTPRILIYTTHSYPELEKMAHATGCHGFVLKSNASKDLLRGARAVLRGDEFYSTQGTAARGARS
jgi:signal transduction histidine kinase